MKVSGKKVAEHRAALVATARKLVQDRGFDGAGVADISREAGLTQGALYGQFKSKDALAAEACRQAFSDGATSWRALAEAAPDDLSACLDAYLSEAHVEDVGAGCLMAACVSEVRRQDPTIAKAFADGFAGMIEPIQNALSKTAPPETARARAIALVSAMIGSVALARAVAATQPDLAKEILAAARSELARFIG